MVTSVTSLSIQGTASPGAVVDITVDDDGVLALQLDGGQTSFSATITLDANASNTVDVVQVVNGASSAATALTVIEDNTPPATTWVAPDSGSVVLSTRQTLEVSSQSPGIDDSVVAVAITVTATNLDGGAPTVLDATPSSGTLWVATWDPPAGEDGVTYSLVAVATDAVGNTEVPSASNSILLTVDTIGQVGPPTNVTSTPSSPTDQSTVTLSGADADPNATTVVLTDNGSPVGTTSVTDGTFTFGGVALSSGANVFTLVAEDPNGIQSPPAQITVDSDTTAPATDWITPSSGAVISSASAQTLVVSSSVSGPGNTVAGVTITVTEAGSAVATLTANAVGGGSTWEASWTPPAGQNGSVFVLTALATDAAGNAESASSANTISLIVDDLGAPIITAPVADGGRTFVTGNTAVTVAGIASPGSTVDISVNGGGETVLALDAGQTSFSDQLTLSPNSTSLISVSQVVDGGTSPSAYVTVIEINPPITTWSAPINGASIDTTATQTLTVSSQGFGATVEEVTFTVDPYPDGGALAVLPATPGGGSTWSADWTPPSGQEGSPITLQALAVDNLGNQELPDATNTITVTLSDLTAPVITAPTSDGGLYVTSNTSVTVSGIAVAGSTVNIAVNDGGAIAITLDAGQTSFSDVITLPSNATSTLAVTQTVDGGISAAALVTIIEDNTAPTTTWVFPDAGTQVTTTSQTLLVNSVSAGTDDPVASVTITVTPASADAGAGAVLNATMVSANQWQATWNPPSGEAGVVYSLQALAADSAGNQETGSGSNTISLTVNDVGQVGPPTNVTSTPTSPTNQGSATIQGNDADPTAVTVLLFAGTTEYPSATIHAGAFSFPGTPLSAGANTFTLIAENASHVQSPPVQITIDWDTSHPNTTWVTPTSGSTFQNDNPIILTVSSVAVGPGNGVQRVDIFVFQGGGQIGNVSTTAVAGTSDWTGSWTPPTQLAGTVFTFQALAKDLAGNVEPPSSSNTTNITVSDAVIAAPTISTSTSSPTNQTTIVITGTEQTPQASLATLYLNGTPTGATAPISNGAFTFTGVQPTPNNISFFTAVASDTGGNQSPSSNSLVMIQDSIPPQSSITSPSNGSLENGDFVLSGLCSDNDAVASVTVIDNGTPIGQASLFGSGGSNCSWLFSYSMSGNQVNVSHHLQSQATDGAGNVETPGSGITLSFDDVPPGPPTNLASPPGSLVDAATTEVTISGDVPCSAAEVVITGPGFTGEIVQAVSGTGNPATCTGTLPFTATNVPLAVAAGKDTPNTLSVEAQDAWGNDSSAATIDVLQDSSAPSIASVSVGGQTERDVQENPGSQPAFQQVPAGTGAIVIKFDINNTQDGISIQAHSVSATTVILTSYGLQGAQAAQSIFVDCTVTTPASGVNATEVITCTPDGNLAENSVYTLSVTNGITDDSNISGNALSNPQTYTIYTVQNERGAGGVIPSVTGSTPADLTQHIAVVDGGNDSLTLNFNEAVNSAGSGLGGSVTDPVNYTIEDCYLRNTNTDSEGHAGCTDITSDIASISWAPFSVSGNSYQATLHLQPNSLGGWYHSYLVTLKAGVADLGSNPTSSYSFLYTNANQLPPDTVDGGVMTLTPTGDDDQGILMFGTTDPDNNPAVFWVPCTPPANGGIQMIIWDGEEEFVTIPVASSSYVSACGSTVGGQSAQPNTLSAVFRTSAGSDPALFDTYVAWTQVNDAGASTPQGVLQLKPLQRTQRWQWPCSPAEGSTTCQPPSPTNLNAKMNAQTNQLLSASMVMNNSTNAADIVVAMESTSTLVGGLEKVICANEACTQIVPGDLTNLTTRGVGNADGSDRAALAPGGQSAQSGSVSAFVNHAGAVAVVYTTTSPGSNQSNLYYRDDTFSGSTPSINLDPSHDVDDFFAGGAVIEPSSGEEVVALFSATDTAFVKSSTSAVANLSSTAAATVEDNEDSGSPWLDLRLATYTSASGATQGAAFFRNLSGGDRNVYLATTTTFASGGWTVTAIDGLAAGSSQFGPGIELGHSGGQAEGAQGGFLFQAGALAGHWGDFYVATDLNTGGNVLVYRQQ